MDYVEVPPSPDQGEPEKGLSSRGADAAKQAQAQRPEKQAQKTQELDERPRASEEHPKGQRQALLAPGHELFEYRVVPIRSTLLGDQMNVGEVERVMNDWGAQGWRVRSVVETQVGGRVAPGGLGELVIVFERRLRS